jgi:hypothetical protein
MSWKQLPDGSERLEAFLREMRERDSGEGPRDPSRGPPRSGRHALLGVLVLALVLAAVWLLW